MIGQLLVLSGLVVVYFSAPEYYESSIFRIDHNDVDGGVLMTEMSFDNIRITAASCKLDFKQAKYLAEQVILGMVRTPRLIAWKDSHKSNKQALARGEETTRLSLAQDAGVRVEINDNEYSFIFAETE